MRTRTAIILAIPIALGLSAWIARAPKREIAVSIASTGPAPVPSGLETAPPSPETPPSEKPAMRSDRDKALQRWRRQCLLEDFESRVRQLIGSIDWTSADSRVRFPVEHERLLVEYDEALGQLPAADE